MEAARVELSTVRAGESYWSLPDDAIYATELDQAVGTARGLGRRFTRDRGRELPGGGILTTDDACSGDAIDSIEFVKSRFHELTSRSQVRDDSLSSLTVR